LIDWLTDLQFKFHVLIDWEYRVVQKNGYPVLFLG